MTPQAISRRALRAALAALTVPRGPIAGSRVCSLRNPDLPRPAAAHPTLPAPGVTRPDGAPLDPTVAANFDGFGLGSEERKFHTSEVVDRCKSSEVLDPSSSGSASPSSRGLPLRHLAIGLGLVAPPPLARSFDEFGDASLVSGSGAFVATEEWADTEAVLTARQN